MNNRIVSWSGAVLASLLLIMGCASPLSTLVNGTGAALPALASDESRLVISLNDPSSPSLSRALSDSTYMTLQLKSVAENTTKYASATGSAGTFTFTLKGLVAGEWSLRAMLYDDSTNQELLYYGNTKVQISAGTSRSVTIPVKAPGIINGGTVELEALADHVNLFDANGFDGATPRTLPVGTLWPLFSEVWSDAGETAPATQGKVIWSSSNESIAQVSSTGKVTILKAGGVTISAAAVDDETVSASYLIDAVAGVVGTWKFYSEEVSMVFSYGASTYVMYQWDRLGHTDIVQGNYSLSGDVLNHTPTQRLDKATGLFAPSVSNEDGPGQVFVEILGDTLQMSFYEEEDNELIDVYFNRIGVKPVTGVSVSGQSGSTVPVPFGATFEQLGVTITPADATFGALYWQSDDPAVMGWDPQSERFVATSTTAGTTTVRGYSLDDLATPVVTYTVNTVTNAPPTVSDTIDEIVTNKGYAEIHFTVSDDVGIQSLSLQYDGSAPNPEYVNFGKGSHQATLYAGGLPEGVSAVRVVATDTTGQVTYSAPIIVYVDSMAPEFMLQNPYAVDLDNPLAENASHSFSFTLSDGNPYGLGYLDGLPVVTSDVGVVSEVTGSEGYFTFTYDLTGVFAGPVTHWIKVFYKDNFGNTRTVFLDFFVVVPQS